MHQHMMEMGPFWGNVAIIVFCGAITIGCFAAMFKFLFKPGETDADHAKYDILRSDR